MARFTVATCWAYLSRELCVRFETSARSLQLHSERERSALEDMRAGLKTEVG